MVKQIGHVEIFQIHRRIFADKNTIELFKQQGPFGENPKSILNAHRNFFCARDYFSTYEHQILQLRVDNFVAAALELDHQRDGRVIGEINFLERIHDKQETDFFLRSSHCVRLKQTVLLYQKQSAKRNFMSTFLKSQ